LIFSDPLDHLGVRRITSQSFKPPGGNDVDLAVPLSECAADVLERELTTPQYLVHLCDCYQAPGFHTREPLNPVDKDIGVVDSVQHGGSAADW